MIPQLIDVPIEDTGGQTETDTHTKVIEHEYDNSPSARVGISQAILHRGDSVWF